MKLLESYLFELDIKNVSSSLKDSTPSSLKKLTEKQLYDYHYKCHLLYGSNIKRKNKKVVNQIVNWHDMVVDEMLRRGIKHNTPLKRI
jgi:hypothetical protein